MTLLVSIPFVESPNRSARPLNIRPSLLVVHYTGGGDATGTLGWLTSPASRCSAHFLIGRNGHMWQMVKLRDAAWHAGRSRWKHEGRQREDVNDFSIGVELANHGPLIKRDDGTFAYLATGRQCDYVQSGTPEFRRLEFAPGLSMEAWWEPYYEAQLAALESLTAMLRQHYTLELVGHEEIASPFGRKSDPGPMFPWERFSERPRRTRSVKLFG